MNLTGLIDMIKNETESTVGVNSCMIGDVYDEWAKSNVKYVSVCWNLESVEPTTDDTGEYVTYNFILYCSDRLNESDGNLISVWDYSFSAIQRILKAIEPNVCELSFQTITPFKQSFNDYIAGGYCPVMIRVESEINDCNY